jgi:hypothetical protein
VPPSSTRRSGRSDRLQGYSAAPRPCLRHWQVANTRQGIQRAGVPFGLTRNRLINLGQLRLGLRYDGRFVRWPVADWLCN